MTEQPNDHPESWPPMEWPEQPVRIEAPSRQELFYLRVLIILATVSFVLLLIYLNNPSRIGDPLAYIALTIALLIRIISLFFQWYNYWNITVPTEIKPQRKWTVDVFTTACPGEPIGMIVRTLKAMTAIRYPHKNYLCDEGNDFYLKRVCDELGITHVTRTDRKDAKAGNINNALKQATGEISVVIDPDHEPAPFMLDRILGYFEDPAVGFVQSVQAYRNQQESFVALAAAEQSYHFYGPFLMGANGYHTTQAIGANCVFRRAALDSIGGHAPGLAEDMHTAMRLYGKGWRSIYLPEILTRGLTPSTLAAFYKQQLKWACGVFDLFFQVYPNLFRSFTLRQKIHFLFTPVFYLTGLIVLLEIVVLILCMVYGFFAWNASIVQILTSFLVVVVFATLVRISAQRWLIEPRERGMHFSSGVLTTATWWVYLVGVSCAALRIKIPYIPTPKEDKPADAWRVALPNLIFALILVVSVIFGVYRDTSPPTLVMAFMACVIAVSLVFVSLISQQVTMRKVWEGMWLARETLRPAKQRVTGAATPVYRGALRQIREGWFLAGAVVVSTVVLYYLLVIYPNAGKESPLAVHKDLDVGGFYTGIGLGDLSDAKRLERVSDLEKQLDFRFRYVSLDLAWGDPDWFPMETLKQLRRQGAVPLINWLPTIDPSSGPGRVGPLDHAILKAICDGKYDDYLRQFADKVRAFGEPLMISFAPQADNPQMPWSTSGGNSPADFIAAWRHIVGLFYDQGASNAGWVWNPASVENVAAYFPGQAGQGYVGYIDWIGLSMANDDANGKSFAERYEPFRSYLAQWRLPVMVTDLSTVHQNGVGWLENGASDLGGRYPEIKAVIFKTNAGAESGGLQPLNVGGTASGPGGTDDSQSLSSLKQDMKTQPFSDGGARPFALGQPLWFDLHPEARKHTSIEGGPGHFSLMVDGAPYYIKGIAYNPSYDWHDASLPLNRSEFDADFSAIKGMGANTIRRYGVTSSDRNILNSAVAHDLKVLYGFWFSQDVNYLGYLTNSAKEEGYRFQIESMVLAYRNHSGLLGWCLGNEVWGLLKHQYAKPYLVEQRHAHVLFVEKMAQLIKELDPDHPVFCAQESEAIAGAVSDYAVGAPSLDVISINSYYQADITTLDQVISRIDPSRPYLVSEFGPEGYWNDPENKYDRQGGLLEDTAMHKAWLYADRWREYIQANIGRNVGGFAYCWSDRYEGTSTWFGITDLSGRPKPAVAALKNAWQFPDPHLRGDFPYDAPQILGVDYPTTPQWPHEPFIVKANVDLRGNDHPRFLWSACGPDFKDGVGQITTLNNGESASIMLPSDPGWYRIHLKVLGKSGIGLRRPEIWRFASFSTMNIWEPVKDMWEMNQPYNIKPALAILAK